MQLYEILQDGYHTPLTASQVAELFKAGRLGRHTRCKPSDQNKWRTIDEVFPLLKYQTSWQFSYELPETSGELQSHRAVITWVGAAVASAAALLIYHWGARPIVPGMTTIDQPISAQPRTVAYRSQPSSLSSASASETMVVVPPEQPETQSAIRLAEANRVAEQARREQLAQKEQQKHLEAARQQQLLQQQKAAGRDEHVPLDEWQIVTVGGEAVRVKIHDNDVTSFNVCINSERPVQMPKTHGITHSQTDETLIYSKGAREVILRLGNQRPYQPLHPSRPRRVALAKHFRFVSCRT
jgi:hypothetical protein